VRAYPGHFVDHATQWPRDGMKRGNAIKLNADTKKMALPERLLYRRATFFRERRAPPHRRRRRYTGYVPGSAHAWL
jgi:hypothetical protein